MSLPPLVALIAFTLECLAVGWVGGLDWPTPAFGVACWSLRFLVGLTLLGAALLLQAFTPLLSFDVPWIALVLALALAATVRLALRRHWRRSSGERPLAPGRREMAGWLLLAVVLGGALMRAWIVPEAGWDAYSHWGYKAQAYFVVGHYVPTNTAHEYYPPLVPFLETHLFSLLGASSIDLAKVIWALVGSAFGFCLAWSLRLTLAPRHAWRAPLYALGVVLGTEMLLESFWTGQADLALTAFLCLGTLALFQAQRCTQASVVPWAAQAALFLLATSLTKYEGIFRVGLVLAVFGLEALVTRTPRHRWLPPLLASGLAAGAGVVLWAVFQALFRVTPSSEHMAPPNFRAVPSILEALLQTFAGIRSGGSLLVVAIGLAGFWAVIVRPPYRFLTLVVAAECLTTLLSFLTSATDPALEVLDAANRLFLQWLPLAFVLVAQGIESSSRPLAAPAARAAIERETSPPGAEVAPV